MRTPANPLDSLVFPPEIDAHMRALITRVGGGFWGRGVIEPKTRSLTTMAVLCTRNLQAELALHVRLGIERYGASREEICEVIAHCACTRASRPPSRPSALLQRCSQRSTPSTLANRPTGETGGDEACRVGGVPCCNLLGVIAE
jgi:hypothetical protein